MSNNFQQEIASIPLWAWILIIIQLLAQGIWLFKDSQKKGVFPWFWGLWGLINFPTPLIVYYFFIIRRHNKKNK